LSGKDSKKDEMMNPEYSHRDCFVDKLVRPTVLVALVTRRVELGCIDQKDKSNFGADDVLD
jgi:hypothetical protein